MKISGISYFMRDLQRFGAHPECIREVREDSEGNGKCSGRWTRRMSVLSYFMFHLRTKNQDRIVRRHNLMRMID